MTGVHEAAQHRRALLRRRLEECVTALVTAVGAGVPFEEQLTALRNFLTGEVLPHAEAAERALRRTAVSSIRAGALVRMMRAEYRSLASLTERLAEETDGVAAAGTAEWIATLFAGHIAKENALPVPAPTGARPGARP